MSAALTIARWCWPEREWEADGDDACAWMSFAGDHGRERTPIVFSARELFAHAVHAAERVMIERGHAEAYGQALWERTADVPRSTPGMWRKYALLATAPLDARVRAMASVIEKLEKNT